ncbi:hypothetical protein BZZ01_26865 [Nostocales cyanobacterium HT-58-2]|nr:hypothetical protein BZZ01_26865 [Nostocales cyanobacterium HT-58-2]
MFDSYLIAQNVLSLTYVVKSSFSKKRFLMMTQPQPSVTPKLEDPKFGFNEYAERLNGRAAMIGFLIMVVIEYVTNQGVLSWLGLR